MFTTYLYKMVQMKYKLFFLLVIIAGISACGANTKQHGQMQIRGAMKNVMRKGELFATINLDTLKDKTHLYGMGPEAYLKGEIMIWDGHAYAARVQDDSAMQIREGFELQAPFFAYSCIQQWKSIALPDSVHDMTRLEDFLVRTITDSAAAYFFTLSCVVDSATIHIVNLPKGMNVTCPEDAKVGRKEYAVRDKKVMILGFFSLHHKTIFTHHDTYLHMHLMTEDYKQMGHLDALEFEHKGAILQRAD